MADKPVRTDKASAVAALTGGAVYSKHSGFTLETMTLEQLGRAAQVRVTADQTAIIGGYGSADAVAGLEDQDALSGSGEVGGAGESVVAGADDDGVPGFCGQLGDGGGEPQLAEDGGGRR